LCRRDEGTWVGFPGARARDVFVLAGERHLVSQLSRTPGPEPLRMDRARQVAQVGLRAQVLLDHLGQRLCFPGDVALAEAAASVEAALHALELGQDHLLVFVCLLGVLDVRVGDLGGMDGLTVLTLSVIGRVADSGGSKVGPFYLCSFTYLRYNKP